MRMRLPHARNFLEKGLAPRLLATGSCARGRSTMAVACKARLQNPPTSSHTRTNCILASFLTFQLLPALGPQTFLSPARACAQKGLDPRLCVCVCVCQSVIAELEERLAGLRQEGEKLEKAIAEEEAGCPP